jgi:hypothetical protein
LIVRHSFGVLPDFGKAHDACVFPARVPSQGCLLLAESNVPRSV